MLVLGMLLAAAVALLMVQHFRLDRTLGARVTQTHALDAATYSAALSQARALNTLSYINRGHVAHQVAMAHLVTLGSWAMLGGYKAQQLASANPPAHLVTMFFGPDHGRAYLAARRAAGMQHVAATQGDLASAYTAHSDTTLRVLADIQADIVRNLPHARRQALLQVLSANYRGVDPEQFEITETQDDWPDFLVPRAAGDGLRDFVLETAGKYRFLDDRNYTARNNWLVDPRCAGRRHELRRRGSTQLGSTGLWESIDTESLHALRSNRWIGCYYREYAMGWGWVPPHASARLDGDHVSLPPDNFSAQDFWRWVRDNAGWNIATGSDNPLANSRAVAARPRWSGGGLPETYGLGDALGRPSARYAVTLRQIRDDGPPVTTRSAAEAFYARPPAEAQSGFESANLFRPNWQARLITYPELSEERP